MSAKRRGSKGQPKKVYTLKHLLEKQPGPVKKNEDFTRLISLLKSSPSLKHIKLSRKLYSSLNNCKSGIGLLRRYNHPFFSLFLKVKDDYLRAKAERKRKREEYIFKQMKALAPLVRAYLKELRIYEQRFAKKAGCWRARFYPKTKKLCRELCCLNFFQWYILFQEHRRSLVESYPGVDETYLARLLSLFLLELPPAKYGEAVILGQYRKLAYKYHPDCGGTPLEFDHLQQAKKRLTAR